MDDPRLRWRADILVLRAHTDTFGKQALRPHDQHQQKGDMAGGERQADIDLAADGLRQSEQHAAG